MIGRVRRYLWSAMAAVLLVGAAAIAASTPVTASASASASVGTSTGVEPQQGVESAPGGRPGTVIGSEAIPAPAGARAWRVRYHSRSLTGADVAVSGVVVAPDGPVPKGGRPVVAWAHPTTGNGDGCAPSDADDAASRILWVDDLLAAGYVVAATDYEGLGTPGTHPYLVGQSEGRGVLDAVRAARALPTDAGRKVVVIGHSQGGHAALFAGEIAPRYAPELSVRGVAPGAPVADVAAFLAHTVEHHGTLGFLALAAAGYPAAYPDLASVDPFAAGEQARADLARSACATEVLAAFTGADPGAVFARDPRSSPDWVRRLQENAPGRRRSAPAVLLWQGDADDLTLASTAAEYVARACARGTRVRYRVYPGATHVTVLGAAHDDVFTFLAERFAGRPPADDCPR